MLIWPDSSFTMQALAGLLLMASSSGSSIHSAIFLTGCLQRERNDLSGHLSGGRRECLLKTPKASV